MFRTSGLDEYAREELELLALTLNEKSAAYASTEAADDRDSIRKAFVCGAMVTIDPVVAILKAWYVRNDQCHWKAYDYLDEQEASSSDSPPPSPASI